MNDKEIIERMRRTLVAHYGGTGKVVTLQFQHGHFNETFVQECISELEKLLMMGVLGELPNPLEKLAIHLLMDSAGIDLRKARRATGDAK